jgi:plastocyanin
MSTRIPRTWYPVIGAAAILFAVLLAGCTGTNYGPAPVTTQATPETTSSPATPVETTLVMTTTVVQTPAATTPLATTAPATTPTIPTPPPAVAVTIQDFAFDPPLVTVPVGTTVTWTNQDSAPHQIVSDATPLFSLGALFTSNQLLQGQKFSFTFNNAGTYAYHCGIHLFMKGTVTVT